jgi:hypothetical protein
MDPELQPIMDKIEEVMQGKPFRATQAWKEQRSDGGPSLAQVQEQTTIGGCTLAQPEALRRWRESFKSTAAKFELRHDLGHAIIPTPYVLTQADVGEPKPPTLRDPIRTREQMEDAIVEHCVQAMKVGEAHLVLNSDDRRGELIVVLKPQYKPEDSEHIDPRMCLGLFWANEPAKSEVVATKRRGGFRQSRTTTHRDDLSFLADAP